MLLFLFCYIMLSYCQYLKQTRSSLHVTSEDTHAKATRSLIGSDSVSRRKKHKHAKTNQSEESDSTKDDSTAANLSNDLKSEEILFNIQVPVLFSAISSNGLIYFLLANVFTGLINLTVPTIHIDGCPAVLIICGYMAALNIIIVIMYKMKIKII